MEQLEAKEKAKQGNNNFLFLPFFILSTFLLNLYVTPCPSPQERKNPPSVLLKAKPSKESFQILYFFCSNSWK